MRILERRYTCLTLFSMFSDRALIITLPGDLLEITWWAEYLTQAPNYHMEMYLYMEDQTSWIKPSLDGRWVDVGAVLLLFGGLATF